MKDHDVIDMVPVYREELSMKEFVKLVEENQDKILRSKPVPAKLGGKGFGKIEVEYKYPTYKFAL